MSISPPTSLHFHIDAITGTEIHLHFKTTPGERSSELTNQMDFVNTMVDEIVKHPQTDFALCLAFKLGVGDLFEGYLMEQSSAHKTSKEKVQFDTIMQSLQIITLTGLSFVEAVEVCRGQKCHQEPYARRVGEHAERKADGPHTGNYRRAEGKITDVFCDISFWP